MINDEEHVELIQFREPMWNEVSKEHDCDDTFNSAGYEFPHFKPIVLRFNAKDYLNNFCVF